MEMKSGQNVIYCGTVYSITNRQSGQIGFLAGMIDAGLFTDLELPLHSNPQVSEMGSKILGFMMSNSTDGINYLEDVILGGLVKEEYTKQIKNGQIPNNEIRVILAQVFALLALSDYWDCPIITKDCADFIALCLSATDPQSVKEWFSRII